MKQFVLLKTSAVFTLLISTVGSLSASDVPKSKRNLPRSAFQQQPPQQKQQKQSPSRNQQQPQQQPPSDSFGSVLRQQATQTEASTVSPTSFVDIRRRSSPIVDSTWLRSLSNQKSNKQRIDPSEDDGLTPEQIQYYKQQQQQSAIQYGIDEILTSKQQQTNTQQQPSTGKISSEASYAFDIETQSVSIQSSTYEGSLSILNNGIPDFLMEDAWVTEYSTQRVVDVLLSHCTREPNNNEFLDPDLIIEAGKSVEAIAISRISRRRFRIGSKEWYDSSAKVTVMSIQDGNGSFSNQYIEGTTEISEAPTNGALQTTIPSQLLNGFASSDGVNGGIKSNVESIVDLLLEYGLTIKDVTEILIHTPGIALMRPISLHDNDSGETLRTVLDRVLSTLMGPVLNLRKYDARKVLRNTPGLLTKNGSKGMAEVVSMLTRMGVSSNAIVRDKNSLPRLLSRSPKDLFRLVAFLAGDAIRMPINNVGSLIRRSDCMTLLDATVPVHWIMETNSKQSIESNSTVSSSVESVPVARNQKFYVQTQAERITNKIQAEEIYRTMTKTAWTLRNEIGTADLSRVIAAYPSVLLLDAEKQILPVAKYLMEDLGIWEDDLPRVLQLYPVLLGMDIAAMKRVVDYLISLEVDKESLSSIFRSFPSLLTMDVERDMMPVADFLANHIGISNVGRFITRLPPVLGYSIDNELKPKWEYLQQIASDPRFAVSKFPAVFSYPLDRIKDRFEYLLTVKGIPSQIISLDQVLCYGDRDFAVKVARDKDSGLSYGKFVDARRNKITPSTSRSRKKSTSSVSTFSVTTSNSGPINQQQSIQPI